MLVSEEGREQLANCTCVYMVLPGPCKAGASHLLERASPKEVWIYRSRISHLSHVLWDPGFILLCVVTILGTSNALPVSAAPAPGTPFFFQTKKELERVRTGQPLAT